MKVVLSMKVVDVKPFRITLPVQPSKARIERTEGNLYALTRFLMEAPEESPLSQFLVDPEHCGEAFPRLLVDYGQHRQHHYTLYFYVQRHQDTDRFVEELRAAFNKNDWEA